MSELIVQENKQIAVTTEAQAIMSMIEQIALNPAVDVTKLRAVMDMKMEMFDKGAEIEFNAAMARAQGEMQPVVKTAENKQTKSRYALLEAIYEQCSPIWTRHGFALSFNIGECPLAGHYRVLCECTHSSGFKKNYQADLPADLTGIAGSVNKTGVHGFGSTVAYGRRYLTCMIFNIAVKNEDNDGNSQQLQALVTVIQAQTIAKKLESVSDVARTKFTELYGDPKSVLKSEFDEVMAKLNASKPKVTA